ncbi:MAG: VWA domain-containing protein [Candidatus Sulfotelmatobacter sp.]
MARRPLQRVLLIGILTCTGGAQVLTIPTRNTDRFNSGVELDAIQAAEMDFNIFAINSQDPNGSLVQSPSASVSKLDLKAPGKAQREYEKGFQLLMKKDLQAAVAHLGNAIQIYPSFVAAHNALGSAYLQLEQNEQARGEFDKAVTLDDHLPNSYLNLGCAQLALKQYSAAEESLHKASSIAPLDVQLQLALAYGEFANHDYPAVIETTHHVHEHKHKGAALVHYFAGGAWAAQNNLVEAQHEMETVLKEDPKSGSADQVRKVLEQLKTEQLMRAEAKLHPVETLTLSLDTTNNPPPEQKLRQAQQVLQDIKERTQIAEAEAEPEAEPEARCTECGAKAAVAPGVAENGVAENGVGEAGVAEAGVAGDSSSALKRAGLDSPAATFRAAVDEVTIFFAATDHGKSATNLTASDIMVRDDNRPPHAILGFRNESQLPLRLGLIIDTSNSVKDRISFEEAAATKFLETVVTGKDDLAFVVGVNNSVLLVQDFSGDQAQISHEINQLAPGGGTALWDAVSFGADKLRDRFEGRPVARVLIVISDGEDNASSATLKQAIASAQHGEVAVYTVSTRDYTQEDPSAELGDHALRTLSELTGGTAFIPGSVRGLKGSLAELQQVIRGRYLVSYKPAAFQRDGRYREIDITAEKNGRKLKVYARKGYYAAAAQPASEER